MAPLLSKSRKPRFELHLKIYDLNNVPLVSGTSYVKWQMPYSIHSEHHGRTSKQPVANHRVDYNYGKIIPLRLVVDRSNRLSDYPIEFEIVQEFAYSGAGRDEKITLGKIALNLAEYVAESEGILRDTQPFSATSETSHWNFAPYEAGGHHRQRSSLSGKATFSSYGTGLGLMDGDGVSTDGGESLLSISPSLSSRPPPSAGSSIASTSAQMVEDGVTRRYLMQDSKINSTLKISVLMIQVDGERNFVAPPLRSAPVFGGIAGIMASGEVLGGGVVSLRDDFADPCGVPGARATATGRDVSEVQDVYRRALAASWACEQGELPADECIEDIFNGGDGFRRSPGPALTARSQPQPALPSSTSLSSVAEDMDKDSEEGAGGSSSSGHKKGLRFIPRLPLRRRTAPASTSSTGKSVHKAKSNSKLAGKCRVMFDSGGNTTSSGDDGGTSSGSGGRTSTHLTESPRSSNNDAFEANATLRPSDLRQLRVPQTIVNEDSCATLRQHEREDSVLSDRTVRGTDAAAFNIPRSARSSPGPSLVSAMLQRDPAWDSRNLADNGGRRTPGQQAGRSVSGGGGIAAPGRGRKSTDVDENEVRDSFVSWQMSSSVAAS